MPNLLIKAGPGCGKTTTIIDAFKGIRAQDLTAWEKNHKHHTDEQRTIIDWCRANLPEECKKFAAYMAFNNSSKKDLERKIHKESQALTSHGWGYSVLKKRFGYLKLNENRTLHVVEKHIGQRVQDLLNKEKFQWLATIRYLEKLKDELLEPTEENFNYIYNKYEDCRMFPVHPHMSSQVQQILPILKTPSRELGVEFIDQVWLALFVLKEPLYDLGFVDECQDLSPSRLLLAQRLCKNIVFVGDPNQAINAFAGADAHAFEKIEACCDAILPLTITFRNPPNVCERLNSIRPSAKLRPLPGKPRGRELSYNLHELVDHIKKDGVYEQYLIVCRYNYPLVKVGLTLMKAGIPSYILGESLIKSLIGIVKNRKAGDIEELNEKLIAYGRNLTRNCPDYVAELIEDKIRCIQLVLPNCTYVEDVEKELKSMLQPARAVPHVRLSTVHKAKGLEAENVVLLHPPMRSNKATTPDQIEQEINVQFVAESRTSKDTIWVIED